MIGGSGGGGYGNSAYRINGNCGKFLQGNYYFYYLLLLIIVLNPHFMEIWQLRKILLSICLYLVFVSLDIVCISVYLRVCVFPPFLFSLIFQLCALLDKCLNSFNNLYPHIYCVAVLHVIFNSLYLLYLFPQFSFKNLFLSVFFVYLTYTVPSSFTYYYYYWFQLFIIFVIYIYIDWFGLVWKYLHNTHIRIIP